MSLYNHLCPTHEPVAHWSCNVVIELSRRILWETVLKALLKSKKMTSAGFPRLSGLPCRRRKSVLTIRTSLSWGCADCDQWLHCLSDVFQYLPEWCFPWFYLTLKWDWQAYNFQGPSSSPSGKSGQCLPASSQLGSLQVPRRLFK